MQHLEALSYPSWQDAIASKPCADHAARLESGQVLFMPEVSFELGDDEIALIQADITTLRSKNISYNSVSHSLKGHCVCDSKLLLLLQGLMVRYQTAVAELVAHLLPDYQSALKVGRTSLRTVSASGRKTSPKKDDNRLHVDAFPSQPLANMRILRVFSNINPNDKARLWHLGEPFKELATKLIPRIKRPIPGLHSVLNLLNITKQKRSLYDHYMLNIHDKMKLDIDYQRNVPKVLVSFPAGSTWMVFTDIASHAALSGQHLLEQTFYLPIDAMQNPANSPQMILSRLLKTALL